MTARPLVEPATSYEESKVVFHRADILRINAAIRDRVKRYGAVRVQVAYFRCPWPCSPATLQKKAKAAVERWVGYMEKTGWQLVSKPKFRVDKRKPAVALSGDWYSIPVLDEVEIPVAAAFKKTDMEFQRVEVPVQDVEPRAAAE